MSLFFSVIENIIHAYRIRLTLGGKRFIFLDANPDF